MSNDKPASRIAAMTDRELIEAAAKAAGEVYSADANPLERDDLALRLAVKLALEIRPGVGMVTAAGNGVWEEVDTGNHTREEATRRAIVRAAAAMATKGAA
jgi:hypothetical protein